MTFIFINSRSIDDAMIDEEATKNKNTTFRFAYNQLLISDPKVIKQIEFILENFEIGSKNSFIFNLYYIHIDIRVSICCGGHDVISFINVSLSYITFFNMYHRTYVLYIFFSYFRYIILFFYVICTLRNNNIFITTEINFTFTQKQKIFKTSYVIN